MSRILAVKGELAVTLADGREATVEIDLDLSHPHASYGVEHKYTDGVGYDGHFRPIAAPLRVLGTEFSVYIPAGSQEGRPLFTLRMPAP